MGGHDNLTFKASQTRRDQSSIGKVLRKGGNCPEKWEISSKKNIA